jgi:cytochrome c oxidase subunit 1
MYHSYRFGEIVTADDPWGFGNSLEWATSSPPPRHNFTAIPRIRSERPAFEAHYPHLLERLEAEAHAGKHVRSDALAGAAASHGPRQGQRDVDPD